VLRFLALLEAKPAEAPPETAPETARTNSLKATA
jgi:hypothetical protein